MATGRHLSRESGAAIFSRHEPGYPGSMVAVVRDSDIQLPGLVTAHSHAFQRGLRGRAQSPTATSFWSWRELMYRLATALSPESIYDLSHYAFVELAQCGITAVGEFHYIHHQADGQPYDDRTVMADAVIRAARDAGLRISLLRVLYYRGGKGAAAQGGQRRFSDPNVDAALADIESLRAAYRDDSFVQIGVAPHSIRAVPIEWVEEAARYAQDHDTPLHMHVAEQRREIDESIDEYGERPVRLLADKGVLSPRFVAVHATHLEADEVEVLGRSGSSVCICRTTERDLGDGLPRTSALVDAGARLCTGVDSHAISDPFVEARAVELDERSRLEKRQCAGNGSFLLEAATANGSIAIGQSSDGDSTLLDRAHPALAGLDEQRVDDAVAFAATQACVKEVIVAHRRIVEDGRHRGYHRARHRFDKTLRDLLG